MKAVSTCENSISNGDEANHSNATPIRSRTVTARNESVLLKALNEAGLTPVGRAIGHDHSYVSRFRDDQQGMKLTDMLKMLEACGLKLISAGDDLLVMDRKDYTALMQFANKGMRAFNNEAISE